MSRFEQLAERYGLEIVQLPLSNGAWTSAQRITCYKCGATDDVITHKLGGSHMPVDASIRKFKQRGWSIRSKKAICPNCLTPAQRDYRIEPEPQEEIPMAEVANLPEPREPTREQKRRIHDAIEGNWDDRAGRYLGSASDQTIADEVKVPRAWVTEIRADFFGDSGENADMSTFRVELNARIEDVEKLVENAMSQAAAYDKVLVDLRGLRARLERIEKSVLPRR